MKKIAALATSAAVLLFISLFILFAEETLEATLARNGLPYSQIEDVDFGLHGTVLTNVHLPRLGITIKEMRIYATAGDIGRARLGKISIKGIAWQMPEPPAGASKTSSSITGLSDLRPAIAALNTYSTEIEIDDIAFTPAPDLPTVTGKGTIYDRGDRYQLNFSFATPDIADAPQVYELSATLNAELFKKSGALKAQADIQKFDIALPAASAKRITGWASLELPADPTAAPLIGAEITAGSVRIYDVPLTETNVTVSGDDTALKAVLSARLPEKAGAKAGNGIQAEFAASREDAFAAFMATVTATLDDLDTLGLAGVGGSATVNAHLSARKKNDSGYGEITAYSDMEGVIDINARQLTLAQAFTAATGQLAGKLSFDAASKKLSFTTTKPLNLTTQHTGEQWSLSAKAFGVEYDIPAVAYRVMLEEAALASPHIALMHGKADVTVQASAAPVAEGTISGTVSSPRKPAYVMPLKFDATLASLSSRQHTTGFDVAINGLDGALMIKAQGSHDSQSQKGDMRARLVPLDMQAGVRSLDEFFPVTGQYVSDVTGSLGALAQFEWSQNPKTAAWDIRQRGRLLLRDLGAQYSGFPIVGINTVISFDSLLPLTFSRQQVAIGAFTAGLPLQNGLVTLSLDAQNRLSVHDGKMEMAGGRIGVAPFTLDLVKQQADIVLTADNLDLKQIFAIAPLEGLSAEGRMQGRLPISMRDGNLSLDKGELTSLGPGVIRYSPRELPAFLQDDTNQHIVDLRTALANFNFSSLKMGLQGDLLKEQTVTLNIEGKNPNFYDGHPVKLNLNVEGPLQNIVRYAPGNESIPDAIQKQIEQFEDANANVAP